MAGNVICMKHQVGRFYGLIAKTQMGNGCATGLFTVIRKVPLGIKGGLIADDLNSSFIGPDCPIRT